jgi:hypothetical protein
MRCRDMLMIYRKENLFITFDVMLVNGHKVNVFYWVIEAGGKVGEIALGEKSSKLGGNLGSVLRQFRFDLNNWVVKM